MTEYIALEKAIHKMDTDDIFKTKSTSVYSDLRMNAAGLIENIKSGKSIPLCVPNLGIMGKIIKAEPKVLTHEELLANSGYILPMAEKAYLVGAEDGEELGQLKMYIKFRDEIKREVSPDEPAEPIGNLLKKLNPLNQETETKNKFSEVKKEMASAEKLAIKMIESDTFKQYALLSNYNKQSAVNMLTQAARISAKNRDLLYAGLMKRVTKLVDDDFSGSPIDDLQKLEIEFKKVNAILNPSDPEPKDLNNVPDFDSVKEFSG